MSEKCYWNSSLWGKQCWLATEHTGWSLPKLSCLPGQQAKLAFIPQFPHFVKRLRQTRMCHLHNKQYELKALLLSQERPLKLENMPPAMINSKTDSGWTGHWACISGLREKFTPVSLQEDTYLILRGTVAFHSEDTLRQIKVQFLAIDLISNCCRHWVRSFLCARMNAAKDGIPRLRKQKSHSQHREPIFIYLTNVCLTVTVWQALLLALNKY